VVIVVGVGGIGMNAVQGAAHAGASVIIAVDPVPMKRDASFRFGATHAVETIDEAAELARGCTNGQGSVPHQAVISRLRICQPCSVRISSSW
jgi:Zn-dependent alcohol dehydrogenase